MRSIFKRKSGSNAASGKVLAKEFSDEPTTSFDERDDVAKMVFPNDSQSQIVKQGKGCNVRSRDGVPIITSEGADHFVPSAVSGKNNYAVSGFYTKKDHNGLNRPRVRPSAKNAAFSGAPRYDWMDIETTAAIKVQAVWRRIQTQNRLDRAGISTPGMRNRRRKRNARYKARMKAKAEDVPFPFNLCGVGLLFGDATLEDEAVTEDMEKRRLRKEKEQFELEEERKRRFHMRKKSSAHIEEGIEVLDN